MKVRPETCVELEINNIPYEFFALSLGFYSENFRRGLSSKRPRACDKCVSTPLSRCEKCLLLFGINIIPFNINDKHIFENKIHNCYTKSV